MKVVIAPDSFKGSLNALEVAQAINSGIKNYNSNIETNLLPMADGGEGTVHSLVKATKGNVIKVKAHDPLYRETDSFYGILGNGKTAIIEMAAASGLPLLQLEERNPLKTTTYGTGELIIDALNKGCKEIIIGLGGSATNDGGCGMAQALGAHFFDKRGKEIGFGGGELSKIHTIDLSEIDSRITKTKFVAACDVDNPLCGKKGTSEVYSRQKGATEAEVKLLDKSLAHYARVIKQYLNKDIVDNPGVGAAGGLGAGVLTFLGAELKKGFDVIATATHLESIIEKADLVITGEGMLDFQTAFGKAPMGVCKIAKRYNKPVIAIAGSLGENYRTLYNKGFDGLFSIVNKPMSLEEAIENASELLEEASENIIRFRNVGEDF